MNQPHNSPLLRCRTRLFQRLMYSRPDRTIWMRRESLSTTVTLRDRLFMRMLTTRGMVPIRWRLR